MARRRRRYFFPNHAKRDARLARKAAALLAGPQKFYTGIDLAAFNESFDQAVVTIIRVANGVLKVLEGLTVKELREKLNLNAADCADTAETPCGESGEQGLLVVPREQEADDTDVSSLAPSDLVGGEVSLEVLEQQAVAAYDDNHCAVVRDVDVHVDR